MLTNLQILIIFALALIIFVISLVKSLDEQDIFSCLLGIRPFPGDRTGKSRKSTSAIGLDRNNV